MKHFSTQITILNVYILFMKSPQIIKEFGKLMSTNLAVMLPHVEWNVATVTRNNIGRVLQCITKALFIYTSEVNDETYKSLGHL